MSLSAIAVCTDAAAISPAVLQRLHPWEHWLVGPAGWLLISCLRAAPCRSGSSVTDAVWWCIWRRRRLSIKPQFTRFLEAGSWCALAAVSLACLHYMLSSLVRSQWPCVSASDQCERTEVRITPWAVVFIATAAAIYSLGHGLRTFTAVPMSTRSSTLRGTVKWVSAYGLRNNNNGDGGCGW